MSEGARKIVLFTSYAIFFAAWALPSYFGGALWTLRIDGGRYYLEDHNITTEISRRTLFWLFGAQAAGVIALVLSGVSGLSLLISRYRRRREIKI